MHFCIFIYFLNSNLVSYKVRSNLFFFLPLTKLFYCNIYKIQKKRGKSGSWNLAKRHAVMYNSSIQIIHKAIYSQHMILQITIFSIFSPELSQMVESLKSDLQDVTCKFKGSSFASHSVHLSVYFNIKCSLSCNAISYFKDCGWYGMSPAR